MGAIARFWRVRTKGTFRGYTIVPGGHVREPLSIRRWRFVGSAVSRHNEIDDGHGVHDQSGLVSRRH